MVDWKIKMPWQLIRDEASVYDLDPNLVASIIQTESRGDTYAMRYERDFRFRKEPHKFARINNITEETENLLQSCSFGLMQVMGCVARELGLAKPLVTLFEPDVGIEYGCKKLHELSLKYNEIDDIIASYNSGSVLHKANGEYVNQKYVNMVFERLKEFK